MSAGHYFKAGNINIMIYLFVLITIIGIIYSIYSIYFRSTNEHFSNFYQENNDFADSQKSNFWTKTNRAIDYDPSLENDLYVTKSIFRTVTPFSSQKNTPVTPSFFIKSPIPGKNKKEEECSLVKEPRYLPARNPLTDSGCGWWYIDNPLKDSVGVQGTSGGPYDFQIPDKYPGGRWIWDLKNAQKMEEVKKCKALKICDQVDIFPGECGFCLSTNSGVPTDKYGKNKYPDDPNLNCEDIVTNTNKCPKINIDGKSASLSDPVDGKISPNYLIALAIAVGCTGEGILIKILSTGDVDKYLKGTSDDVELFKIANRTLDIEENIPLKLEFYGKGQCDKSAAIKYYSDLRKAAISGKTINARGAAEFITRGVMFDPCSYSDKGRGPFSLFCLKRVALENMCQPDGTAFPSETPYKVRDVPKKCGRLGRPNGDGSLRLYTEEECERLNGNFNGKDECTDREGNSFSVDCKKVNELQAPPISTKSVYDKMTWSQVNEYFQNLYTSMNSSIKELQAISTKQCLGIELTPAAPVCDDTVGCEVLWYSWNYDYKMHQSKFAKGAFLGRTVQPELPKFNNDTKNGLFNPYNIDRNISFHIRTKYSSKKSGTKKIGAVVTDGICIKIDGRPIIENWIGGPQKSLESEKFIMNGIAQKKLDIYWFKGEDRATFQPRISHSGGIGTYDEIEPADLALQVPSNYPLARWDFYNERDEDRNSILNSYRHNFEYGQKDGKKCAVFHNEKSSLIIKNHIRGSAFKSFTYKIYVDAIPAYWSRLFSFRKGPTSCDGGDTHGNSTTIEGGLCADGRIWMGLKAERGQFYVWNHTRENVFKMGKWFHVSFVFDADLKGSTIFVNGEIVNRVRDETCPGSLFANSIYNNVAIGLGHYAKECNAQPIYCGIAWAHWFDYTLDKLAIRTDSNTAFTNIELYKENSNTGWKFGKNL